MRTWTNKVESNDQMWRGHYSRSNKKCIVCLSVYGNTFTLFTKQMHWASNLDESQLNNTLNFEHICLSQPASHGSCLSTKPRKQRTGCHCFHQKCGKMPRHRMGSMRFGKLFQSSYVHYLCVICWSRIWCQLLLQTCKAHHLTIWPARETLSWIAGWCCCRQTWVQHPSPNLLFHSCPVSLTSTRDWSVQSGPNFSGGTRWCSSCCWIGTAFAIGQQHTQYSILEEIMPHPATINRH